MQKRKFLLLLLAAIMLISLAACKPAPKKATVDVKIVGYKDSVLFDGKVTVTASVAKDDPEPVIADILLSLDTAEEIENLVFNSDYTSIEQIGDYKTQPDAQNTGAYYWTYSINDVKQSDNNTTLTNPSSDKIKDDDNIVIYYDWLKFEGD